MPDTAIIPQQNTTIEKVETPRDTAICPQSNEEVPKKMRLTRERRERLKATRTMYFVQNLTMQEIADQLGVSWMTIHKDIQILRQLAKNTSQRDIALKTDVINFAWEMNLNYKERIKKLYAREQNAAKDKDYIALMKEIREQEKQYVEFLQQSGIIQKEPDKHVHAVMYVSHLDKHKIEQKEKQEEKNAKKNVDREVVNMPL